MLATRHQTGRSARVGRASPWILHIGILVGTNLTPGMAPAQGIDTSAVSQRAAEQPPSRSARWLVVPRVSLLETYTDNVTHAAPGFAKSGWVRDVTPGIHVQGNGPRVSGFLDYGLRDVSYADQSQLNRRQNLLSSFVTIEALDNWLYLDARANITQQNTSAHALAPTEALTWSRFSLWPVAKLSRPTTD